MSQQRKWTRRSAITAAAGVAAATSLTPTAHARPPAGGGQTALGRLYEIRSGRHRVVVAGVAATLLSWQVDGTEMLLTHDPSWLGEGYQGKTILPWPNRIESGRYTFGGQQLQVPINEPSRQAALHGLMSWVEWQPVRHRGDGVVLEHLLHPHYGYPFTLALQIEFTVDGRGVSSRLSAKNVGDTDAPFGTANHTYIAASGPAIDTMGFELPASTYYVTDDNLIPTGTAPVAGTEYDFRSARRIGATKMDTAFTDLARESGGEAVVRFERPGGQHVELWVDRTHGYLQVYTDDSPSQDRPARAGITVEPMTCAPNAFVTGDGLITLRPGEVHEGRWGYRIG
ncbi:aldose 1-epimerase [Saccharopolyspora erythraea NRRL 2338]|uniref:Predicted aldose-1-epimerase n=2 Tax=Saccharopolyspora erythraea TaxID=1836 RepID=A4FGK0_SACEN|nr:aldose 1-epimerase family protein [Saccharopolyspora erythraea]EQD83502.1 aldose-1-epimerase [Saccharopolyspora erythraea D]PFG96879.1 aldose 1-epimerase [Saccharopolyspora erythraea NRRL 2338]QRK87115.1 aldose 1-epimerase family protein [Saccharopolyspora erythraea]CAM03175.1 predicted aldose-1-epimerase [Saccharopolyspora erythraea NRRL 2338]